MSFLLPLFSRLNLDKSRNYHRIYASYCRKMSTESAGTHKDPITGEMISKQSVVLENPYLSINSSGRNRELKRREKNRAKEASKADADEDETMF